MCLLRLPKPRQDDFHYEDTPELFSLWHNERVLESFSKLNNIPENSLNMTHFSLAVYQMQLWLQPSLIQMRAILYNNTL